MCETAHRGGTILTIKALIGTATKPSFAARVRGFTPMVRPELHDVPRPYMDSTGYKQALREVHEAAQPAERKQGTERSTLVRRANESERPSFRRVA
jgi:hypothetical protein